MGSLSDLIGRRYVAIIGVILLCIGMIVSSTANTMNVFIGMFPISVYIRLPCPVGKGALTNYLMCLGGMAIAGAGAGINELTALAATSEMAPTRQRGKYVSILIFTIVPFVASVLYAQLIAYYAGWRYVGLFCGVWSGLGLVVTVIFYHPPPRVNTKELDRKQIIGQIDFLGGVLSISGLIVFLAGLQWGGYQVTCSKDCCKLGGILIPRRLKVSLTLYPFFSTTGRPPTCLFLSLSDLSSWWLSCYGKFSEQHIPSSLEG